MEGNPAELKKKHANGAKAFGSSVDVDCQTSKHEHSLIASLIIGISAVALFAGLAYWQTRSQDTLTASASVHAAKCRVHVHVMRPSNL